MLQSVETWTNARLMPAAVVTGSLPPARDYGIDTGKLESRRLYMRPMEPSDLDHVLPLLTDPERTLLFFHEPWGRDRAAQWLAERSCWCFWRRGGGPEGTGGTGQLDAVGVGEMDGNRNMTVHAISAPSATGSLVVEAARLGIAVAFERLGARRIVATPIEGNAASIKLVRHLGFRHEGTMRQAIHIAGRYRDIELYALLKED